MTADGGVPAEICRNGVNNLTGLPSSDRTVSLSPDAAVRQSDSCVQSQSRNVALGTCDSLPPVTSHTGTFLADFQDVARDTFLLRRRCTRSCMLCGS